jgi:hypothetical protein
MQICKIDREERSHSTGLDWAAQCRTRPIINRFLPRDRPDLWTVHIPEGRRQRLQGAVLPFRCPGAIEAGRRGIGGTGTSSRREPVQQMSGGLPVHRLVLVTWSGDSRGVPYSSASSPAGVAA